MPYYPAVLPTPVSVANGGTAVAAAGIAAINNITGQSYAGFSGTGNLVGATSPTFTGTVGMAAVTPTGLINISGASAGQIQFPATQNASAGANVLDDYEEGTFTPTIAFGGGTTGITYSTQNGTYTKVGRLVSVSVRIILTSKGSSTGQLSIEGLPFTINANSSCSVGLADSLTLVSGPWGLPNNTTTQILVYNGDGTSITQVNMGNGSSIYAGVLYPS